MKKLKLYLGGAVLYGNGTSGGVINITTNLKNMSVPTNKVGYEFTIDKEKKYYANVGTKVNDRLTVQLNYSKSEKDWYFVDTYSNTQYFSGGFNYKISDRQNFSFKYSRFEEEGQFLKNVTKANLEKYGKDYVPDYTTITTGVDEHGIKQTLRKRKYLSGDREENNYKGTYNFQITDNILFMIDGFKSDGYFINNQYEDNQKIEQETVGTKAKLNINYGNNSSILFGVDYFKQNADFDYIGSYKKRTTDNSTAKADETVDSKGNILYNGQQTYTAVPYTFEYERFVKALYFMNLYKVGNFELTQGMRYDITDWSFNKNGNNVAGEDTRTARNKNYEFSVGYNYRDTGKIYARYERGFTGPDGQQVSDSIVTSSGEKIYKNTEAEDEIFDMYEIGLRDYILGSAISLTAFMSNTDNQMNRVYRYNANNRLEQVTVNYLATERYGAELTLNQSIGKFSFEEGYTYLKGKSKYNDKGNAAVESGSKIDWSDSGLQKVPKHMLSLRGDYSVTDNLTIGAVWKYTGGYNNYYDEADREEDDMVDSHIVVDFSIRYNHPEGFSVYGGINNLFNETYFGYSSAGRTGTVIPEDGRTFYAGFSYTF